MKARFLLITFVLLQALLLASCGAGGRVGALQSESQSVDLADVEAVSVKIDFGAGDLRVTGGAEKLLEADFTFNVDKLEPAVTYKDGALVVAQPDRRGVPNFLGILNFRNEWDLHLYDEVPMDLTLELGAGTSNLDLSGLSLRRLNFKLGAGESAVDLSGDWERDLVANIDSGAANLTVLLPSNVGVRIIVDRGATLINASGLTKDENVYTNAVYGKSDVTLTLGLQTGIGWVNLEVEDSAAANEYSVTE